MTFAYKFLHKKDLNQFVNDRIEDYLTPKKICFLSGGHILHVIDVENVTSPEIIHHMEFDDVDVTDVEYCGGYVFVSMDNDAFKDKGRVVVFSNYSTSELMVEKYNITGKANDVHCLT